MFFGGMKYQEVGKNGLLLLLLPVGLAPRTPRMCLEVSRSGLLISLRGALKPSWDPRSPHGSLELRSLSSKHGGIMEYDIWIYIYTYCNIIYNFVCGRYIQLDMWNPKQPEMEMLARRTWLFFADQRE